MQFRDGSKFSYEFTLYLFNVQIVRSRGGLSTEKVTHKSACRLTSCRTKPRSTTATSVSMSRQLGE